MCCRYFGALFSIFILNVVYAAELMTLASQLGVCSSLVDEALMKTMQQKSLKNFQLIITNNNGIITKKVHEGSVFARVKGDDKKDDNFCNIIKGIAPAYILFADKDYIGIFSQSKKSYLDSTTILVIPRDHFTYITDMSAPELEALLQKGIATAELFGSRDNFTLQINYGSPYQTVPHVHMHVTVHHKPQLKRSIISLMQETKLGKTSFNKIADLVKSAR